MSEIDLLKEQMKENAIKWYPFENDKDYKILQNITKEHENELRIACEELKQDNKIIILMENKMSIKNMNKEENELKKLYNRREMEDLLDSVGIKNRKFYYLLPDVETTNVVFTDENLPNEESISRNINFYEEGSIGKDIQNTQFLRIIKQDKSLFKIFSNAFLIEGSKEEFEDNGIEFVSFSNMRKPEYRIQTVIRGDSVYKKAFNEKSLEHINNIKNNIDILNKLNLKTLDRYNENEIISKYEKNEKTLDETILDNLKLGRVDEAINLIKELFEILKEKLIVTNNDNNIFDRYNIDYKEEDVKDLTFVENGFWDMIFQNIFYINNEFYFYDQEWIENKLPLEFIIYRALFYNKNIKELIDIKEIFGIFGIDDEKIKIFQELDNKLQFMIRDEISWKCHNNLIVAERIQAEKEQILEDCKKLLNEKDSRIKFLKDNIEETITILRKKENEVIEKENKIREMENSKSWKLTKPLRDLKNNKRKGK